ncbi:OLC1v1036942C1 [Oldenlandia corymbosa var. corymbosa]|uniref:OLC1v1036942C1 n=1 Tax=Oldenlandia corymbosa var. corymbosa TaxID=529605 RepID=A0AAV1CWF1_OLDCO|nr:OLC1v1036942C1 [Oldenlandia corymbosa var. corymbosa]
MENSNPQKNPAKRLQEIYAELFRPKTKITKPKRKQNLKSEVGPMKIDKKLSPPPPLPPLPAGAAPPVVPLLSNQPSPILDVTPQVVHHLSERICELDFNKPGGEKENTI